jgi:GntR family transcriptional regulator/MocR family aminotransferase
MSFHVSLVGRKNLSREIYRQISRAILDGRLQPGDQLTPSRELAESLDVSRMTVNVAYERLASEGFVTSRQGAGTFVSESVTSSKAAKPRAGSTLQSRAVWQSISVWDPFELPAYYDFRTGVPDSTLFPHRTWQRCVSIGPTPGVYMGPAGLPALRSAIARQISFSRGVEASAEDVIVTSGTQQALDIITRVLLSPGDTIAVEQPGYFLPSYLFQSMGLRIANVPVDEEGIVVDALPHRAKAVYVTPSHQFPLAVPMTLRRRMALLAWAERNNAAIIEDDYDSEFRFGGRPLESLQSIDAKGHVIYVGSFSKTMLPTLRLGFLIAPPSLRDALLSAKFVTDWHTSGIGQAALARFMEEGSFARHLRKMTTVYRERHAMITEIITRDFADHLELLPSEAGLHLAAYARSATFDQLVQVRQHAAERRVAIQIFNKGLMLGYGAIPAKRIRQGLKLLRESFQLV